MATAKPERRLRTIRDLYASQILRRAPSLKYADGVPEGNVKAKPTKIQCPRAGKSQDGT